ncbi:MAG: hypothetical protein IJD46_01095 [Bacilli bacterium]|nr:hypothetical protein [Bacilli bacterium]
MTESKVFEEDEIYYKLDENGNYILVSETIPDEDTTYYTLNIDRYGGKIINANNKFIVYEDGTIEAT